LERTRNLSTAYIIYRFVLLFAIDASNTIPGQVQLELLLD